MSKGRAIPKEEGQDKDPRSQRYHSALYWKPWQELLGKKKKDVKGIQIGKEEPK